MLYAVTIEPLDAVFFLSERPPGDDWKVQEGVSLDVPANYDTWPGGEKSPEQVLCTLISDPLHYKVVKYRSDIDPAELKPTGKHFGGVYSRSSWARFVSNLPATLAVAKVPDRGGSGASDEAVAAIDQRR